MRGGVVGPDSVHVVVGVGLWGVRGWLVPWAVEESACGELRDLRAVEGLLHVHVVEREVALALGEPHVTCLDAVDLGFGAVFVGGVDAGLAAHPHRVAVEAGLLVLGRGLGYLGHAGRRGRAASRLEALQWERYLRELQGIRLQVVLLRGSSLE